MSARGRPADTAAATRPGLGNRLLLVATALWILCAGVALSLWLLTWSRAPGALLQAVPLNREGVVAQAIALPDDGLERLGLVLSKQGDPWPAAVQVVVLDGDALPTSQQELSRRSRGEVTLRVHGQVEQRLLWRPLDDALQTARGQRLLLLIRRLDDRASTLQLWLESPVASHLGQAQVLRAGQAAAPVTRPVDGAVALYLAQVPLRALRTLAWQLLWLLGLGLLAGWWLRLGATLQVPRPTSHIAGSAWDRRLDLASVGVILVAGVVVLITAGSAGIAWDEPTQAAYGGFLRAYYGRWLPDAAVVDHYPLFNLYLYGGAFEWLLALVDLVSPLDPWHSRHLLTGLMGVAGLVAVRALARRAGGARVALWAVLLLALLPSYNGHWLNNSKDIPFAVGCTWALVALVDVVRGLPRVPARQALHLALAMGLTMGVRVAGVMLPGLALLAVLGWSLGRWRGGVEPAASLRELGQVLLRTWLPAVALAWLLMILCWPWAQQAPLLNPLRALVGFGRFSDYTDGVLLAGQSYLATQVPATYLPHYLLVKLPELHLFLLATAVLLGLRNAWRTRLRLDQVQGARALVAALVVLPVLGAVVLRPSLYDELRQFLFLLPALCALAAAALDKALRWAWSRSRALAGGLTLLCALALLDAVVTTARLAPYQYAYYNRLVGGVAGAQGRYELDYWGLCYREAVSELQGVVDARGLEPTAAQPLRVASCGDRGSSEVFFASHCVWEKNPEQASFLLTHRRDSCRWQERGRSVARVERAGVTLCDVREVLP